MHEKIIRLRELSEQRKRMAHLESGRSALTKQQRELTEQTAALKTAMEREQADVEALRKGGVKALFYGLTGKKQQKLEQEQVEAHTARLQYEAALRELTEAEHSLRRTEAELGTLEGCADEYTALLWELMAYGKDRDSEVQLRELDEKWRMIVAAKSLTQHAMEQIQLLEQHLDEANRWAFVRQDRNRGDEELRKARRIMVPLQEQIGSLNADLEALGMGKPIRFYASMISGLGDSMMAGAGMEQMVKNAKQQNRTVQKVLEDISEELTAQERNAIEEMDKCCERVIKTICKG